MTASRHASLRKGQQTRAAIVNAALEQAARAGLEGLTIGALAEQMHMSKSGVFAHFGSREDLQIAVLKAYEQRFIDEVLKPSLREARGLPRLLGDPQQLARADGDRGGARLHLDLRRERVRRPPRCGPRRTGLDGPGLAARDQPRDRTRHPAGPPAPGHDVDDLVFGIYGVILVLHHDSRLMRSAEALPRARRAIDRLLQQFARVPLQPEDTLQHHQAA